ncbi:SCO4225 family membrane protein [Streptomyces sp. NPDC055815]
MPTASHPRRLPRLRRLLALASGNWLARGYLAVFAVSLAAMFLAPDSALAGSSLLLTAPLSFLMVFLPLDPGAQIDGAADMTAVAGFTGWLVVCALVNAAVLGALATRITTTAPAEQRRRDVENPAGGLRALLAPAVDNWLARGYLAVVAVALGFFLCATFLLPDPGYAGIWPLMATAPLSLLAVAISTPIELFSSITWLGPLVFALGVALSGLVNAVLLGHLARRLRTSEPRPAL